MSNNDSEKLGLSPIGATNDSYDPKASGPVIQIPDTIVSGAPSEKRVEEIAKHLRREARGVGRPITDRGAWEAAYPCSDSFLHAVAQTINTPVPDLTDELYLVFSKTGSRREYEAPYFKRITLLRNFVLAECIENKGRFLPAIENYLNAMLNEKTWALPAHDGKLAGLKGDAMIVDLGVCMRSFEIATTDYLLGNKLRPETRAKIRSEANRRILNPYKESILIPNDRITWWARLTSNWNAVCHAGVVGTALTLITDVKERAWFLAEMEIHLPNYLAGFTPDGYCSEGVGYWNYGFGHYVSLAELAGDATQWYINLYAAERVPEILYFPKKLELLPDLYPAFADCSASAKPDSWIFQIAGRRVATKTPVATKHTLNPMGGFLYQTALIAFSKFPDSLPPNAELPLRNTFPDAGIIVARTAHPTQEKGFAIVIKAGNNDEHHNHNDVGSFVVGFSGQALIVDPGAAVYTKALMSPSTKYQNEIVNSYGHSVPVLAGKLQDTGAEARGTLTVLEASDEKDRCVLDLKAAYIKSVPSLKKMTRSLTFVRTPKPYLEITDEVEFDSPQTFEDALLTFGKCTKGDDPNSYIIYDGLNAIKVKVDTKGKAFTLHDTFLEGTLSSGKKPRRIGFSLTSPVTEARLRYTIEPTDSPASNNLVLDKNSGDARKPRFKDAIRVEAEKFSEQKGGTLAITPKSEGLAINMWDKNGHTVSWDVNIPSTGTYGLLLRYANDSGDAKRSLLVDNLNIGGIQGEFIFKATGGWGNTAEQWKEGWLAQNQVIYGISLNAGKHMITLENIGGGGLNLDWIELIPLDK